MRRLLLLFAAAWSAASQPPDFYKAVDGVTWVVDDLDRAVAGWQKTGLGRVERRQNLDTDMEFRGKRVHEKIRIASGYLGDLRVDWIQPVSGSGPYSEYQKKHGLGIFSLVHRAPTRKEFDGEIERLRVAGIGVLARAKDYVYFDTEPEGKYVLGLICPADAGASNEAAPAGATRIVQFAFAVHDLKPVSAFWEKLGFPPFAFTGGNLSDVRYQGTPVRMEQKFGWQRGRKVFYEWLQPVSSPNIFDDHMKAHGEGIQHLAIQVPDMQKAAGEWEARGFPVYQSGAWGEAGKKGSGRFAYMDTEAIGGFVIELLWNFPG